MDYRKQYDRLSNQVEAGLIRFQMLISLVGGILFIATLIFVLIRFSLISRILSIGNVIAEAFFLLIIVFFVIMMLSTIIGSIGFLVADSKQSVNRTAKLLLFLSSSLQNSMFVLIGLLIVGCGCYIIIVSSLAGGLMFCLMGLLSVAIGLFEIYKNIVFFDEYSSENANEGIRTKRVLVIGNYLLPLGCGLVFSYVPIVMVAATLNTPDLPKSGLVAVLGMGLIFLAVGVYILITTISKLKLELHSLK